MKTFLSVLGLILILIFFFYQNQTKKESVEILQGLKGRTIGVVTYAKGTRFEMEYKLENQTQILGRTRPYVGIQEGESFMLAYDLGDGSKIIPIFSDPQINDSLFNTTHTIEPLSWDFSNLYDDKKAIEFYYKVEGNEFSKYQILGFNINKEDIELEKKYKVKYHKENPKIAYVIFD